MNESQPKTAESKAGSPASPGILAGAVEYFLLRRGVSALPEKTREALARSLRRARQERDNAAMMRAHGSTSEALRLGRRASLEYVALVDALAESDGAQLRCARARRALVECGAPASAQDDASPTPELDADVTGAQLERLDLTLDALFVVDREVSPLLRSAPEARRLRVVRIAVVLAALAVALDVAFTPSRIRPAASGIYSPSFPATFLLDGDLDTEWLSPDETPGWVGFTFSARNVHRIRILNAHNGHYLDRGARDMVVRALYRGRVVFEANAAFERVLVEHDWRTVELGSVRCDEIRIEIPTFHGLGPGLGEVAIE